jgi:hypothetical protein
VITAQIFGGRLCRLWCVFSAPRWLRRSDYIREEPPALLEIPRRKIHLLNLILYSVVNRFLMLGFVSTNPRGTSRPSSSRQSEHGAWKPWLIGKRFNQ